MRFQPWMRHFDFDPEAVIRLSWRGIKVVNIPAPVRYFSSDEGGVFTFSILARQSAAHLDVHAFIGGLCHQIANIAVPPSAFSLISTPRVSNHPTID